MGGQSDTGSQATLGICRISLLIDSLEDTYSMSVKPALEILQQVLIATAV